MANNTQQQQYGQVANYNVSPGTRADKQSTALETDSKGNLKINQAVNLLVNAPLNGQVKMDGSADQFPANVLSNGIIVTAKSTNSASIVIGGSGVTNTTDGTGNGYILEAGASMSWGVSNSNVLYAIGTSGDVISFAGS